MNKSGLAVAAAVALLSMAGGEFAQAFNPQPDPPARSRFGMVGIVRDQTLRINAVALLPAVQRSSPPDPCRVSVSFTDGKGRALSEPVNLSLEPGTAGVADLPGSTVTIEDPNLRIEVHPVVTVLAGAKGRRCRNVKVTAEVFDFTGRTSVLIDDPNL
jgi:hypothetical protein